jgi:uncharacterized metal-binding protein YceD (DUF177 family)
VKGAGAYFGVTTAEVPKSTTHNPFANLKALLDKK